MNEGNDWFIHKELANYIDANFSNEVIVKRGIYKTNGITVEVKEPIEMLMRKGEKSELQHILYVSRHPKSTRAAWRVLDGKQVVASKLVQIKSR